ncbi:DUF5063 domain-containing protein [Salegentibacter mishustinae]|uniref:DUF5063 domain-containing protein n=1 Tax=Salegentibacter mishustinae TaxID=270918 RepID=UPI001CE13FE6|nr:DUF5063 domain-containing protein [Salegentibacter mishustinae]UBZ06372.1 DUF5063 domain-containing protein [Salegentibacter mishustinae]
MSNLKSLIDRIVEFGTDEKLVSANKELEIQKLLVAIYSEYLQLETEFDNTDYEEPIRLDYDGIRSVVTSHFPDFSWYHSVWESHEINRKADITSEDSIDDLTDIIKDLIEVQWRLENNSEKDGLYQFAFLMKNHSEQHLVNLLKYLKDRNG